MRTFLQCQFKSVNMDNLNRIESLNLQCPATDPEFTEFPEFTLPVENSSLQDGRESLGILHPGFEKDINFFSITGKEQLSFKNILELEESDIGRESLGILQINNLNINFGNEDEKATDLMLSFVENDNISLKILDTGFLNSSPSRLISTTSQNSGISFHSNSLEYPSKIFTLSKSEQTNSVFSPTHSLFNNAYIMTTSDLESRIRIHSYPGVTASNQIKTSQFSWETGRSSRMKLFSTSTYHEKLEFGDDKDDMFNDAVFIEGNHIAQKIADGSFLNESFENGPLDSTPQPEWPNDLDESVKSKESVDSKTNTDSVFKTVDKLLPKVIVTNEVSNKIIASTRSSSSSSQSREFKDILQNLSDIFNSKQITEKQKSEGLVLINNLAEMFSNSQSSKDHGLDVSGHSSVMNNDSNKDKQDTNGLVSCDQKYSDSSNKLETSVNAETVESNMNKVLSRSLCGVNKFPKKSLDRKNSSISSMDTNSNKNRSNSNSCAKSNYSNESTFGPKIKSRVGAAGSKKGPLRAIVPVKEMKKASTPERIEQKTLQLHSKKTSTPINEPNLKPVAASTPTEADINSNGSPKWGTGRKAVLNRSNSLPETNNKEKINGNSTPTTSKLRKSSFSTSSSSKEKLNGSPILNRIQDQHKIRRNIVTEGVSGSQFRMKRSNSVGKEMALISCLPKVRENILKSPYYNQKIGILMDSNSKVESNMEKKVTFRKSLDSSVKQKKIGKENIC